MYLCSINFTDALLVNFSKVKPNVKSKPFFLAIFLKPFGLLGAVALLMLLDVLRDIQESPLAEASKRRMAYRAVELAMQPMAPDAEVTGQAMAAFLAVPGQNNFDITGDATTGAGDTTMAWGDATWGNSRWNNGQFVADPDYGQTMTMTLGQETVDLNTPVDVSGISMSMTLNSVAKIIPECNVDVTGNALTFALGTATNVLIWNEVNTGTAPVDPPGWQEVNTNAA